MHPPTIASGEFVMLPSINGVILGQQMRHYISSAQAQLSKVYMSAVADESAYLLHKALSAADNYVTNTSLNPSQESWVRRRGATLENCSNKILPSNARMSGCLVFLGKIGTDSTQILHK